MKNNKISVISTAGVMAIHELITEKSGGSPNIREKGLLESALAAPFQSFAGIELYPTVLEKGAMLGYSLVSNHAFVDGNKRIGMLTMLTFLQINGYTLTADNDEVTRVGLDLAAGEMKREELLRWLTDNTVYRV